MARLSFRTAGESHGKSLVCLVEGLPAGLRVDLDFVNAELRRRQGGYGRSGRQKIESDSADIVSGLQRGVTIGSPIAILISNADHRIDDPAQTPPVHQPRPGHADLSGAIKTLTDDCRPTLERASARETAARTAAGAVARLLLREFDIRSFAFVRGVGDVHTDIPIDLESLQALQDARDGSEIFCPDPSASTRMCEFIARMKAEKDTAGGIVECHVFNCPIGLGSCMTWDGRLDARIAQGVIAVQAFKGVEFGLGFAVAARPGSKVHDEIVYDPALQTTASLGYTRPTNNAGGIEGGMTNGQPVVVRAAMKPISTLGKPLRSIDLRSKMATEAAWERSDISAIAAASVILENVVAFHIAEAFLEKFGGDSMTELRTNYTNFLEQARHIGGK